MRFRQPAPYCSFRRSLRKSLRGVIDHQALCLLPNVFAWEVLLEP